MVVCACNPGIGTADTMRSLELAGQCDSVSENLTSKLRRRAIEKTPEINI